MTLGYGYLDNQPNFDDWKSDSFGDWKEPYAKLYGSETICGRVNNIAWR